jgi:hypothetical protein
MDKVEYTEAERWLIEPRPGTAAARARDFGVDLSITVANLRLTPEERIRKLDEGRALGFPPHLDQDKAMLLELEAILEYRPVCEGV